MLKLSWREVALLLVVVMLSSTGLLLVDNHVQALPNCTLCSCKEVIASETVGMQPPRGCQAPHPTIPGAWIKVETAIPTIHSDLCPGAGEVQDDEPTVRLYTYLASPPYCELNNPNGKIRHVGPTDDGSWTGDTFKRKKCAPKNDNE